MIDQTEDEILVYEGPNDVLEAAAGIGRQASFTVACTGLSYCSN
jgi:hypothetical protein